jgi:2-polyprenyl-6-methoxyphenol hydroxylase-like FAD-dependent oxidoreductase
MVGGGVVGLSAAMLLGRDGHEVTVLERDPQAPPDVPADAWDEWERRGVNQFRMLHFFLPRFRALVEKELPDVARELESAGALRINNVALAPAELTGGARDGDDVFETLTARRPVAEGVFARAAEKAPNVEIRRGVAVESLVAGPSMRDDVPHVVGVRTDTGEELRGDVVIDAAGRRSPLPAMLDALGGRAPEEELEDSGFVYYGRHFRSSDGSTPPIIAPLLSHYGSVSILTLPADNGTWGVGIVASGHDAVLRGVKDVDAWMRTVKSFPLIAHWLDGEPLDDRVAIMAKIEDRHRSFVVDDVPIVTGVLSLGDAWACTNPSVGRGASIGMLHAIALRDLLAIGSLDDPLATAQRWHQVTQEYVEPWYRSTLSFDRHRLAEIEAEIAGVPYETDDPTWEITRALMSGSMQDPDVFRGFLEIAGLISTPDELLARPGMFDRVIAAGAGWREEPVLGPDREQLLKIVAA